MTEVTPLKAVESLLKLSEEKLSGYTTKNTKNNSLKSVLPNEEDAENENRVKLKTDTISDETT